MGSPDHTITTQSTHSRKSGKQITISQKCKKGWSKEFSFSLVFNLEVK